MAAVRLCISVPSELLEAAKGKFGEESPSKLMQLCMKSALADNDVDAMAERAAEMARQRVYEQFGRN